MTNKVIDKDILTVEYGVLVHSVNCQGVMGAGLAKKISNKWPTVKADYLRHCQYLTMEGSKPELETWMRTEVGPNLFVASVFGQQEYGRTPGRCYTSYRALAVGFWAIHHGNQHLEFAHKPLPIYLPHSIGCGLAGGDWHVVSAIIEQELPDAVICRWEA